MSRVMVSKEFTWDMAHMLSGHSGLCANVHGHTYKMQVHISDELMTDRFKSSEGMVIDFKDLKEIVNKKVVDRLDHAFLAWANGNKLEQELVDVLEEHGAKVVIVPWRPTAENMAREFFLDLYEDFGNNLVKVIVWETPTSFAEYGGQNAI